MQILGVPACAATPSCDLMAVALPLAHAPRQRWRPREQKGSRRSRRLPRGPSGTQEAIRPGATRTALLDAGSSTPREAALLAVQSVYDLDLHLHLAAACQTAEPARLKTGR